MPQTHKDAFLASLNRCLESDQFIPMFYGHFMSSSIEVADKFKYTSFDRQREMLVKSLRLIASATEGEIAGLGELRARAETHDRHHLDIKPELYDLWRNSVLKTTAQFDPEWNDETAASWQHILDYAIAYMTKRY